MDCPNLEFATMQVPVYPSPPTLGFTPKIRNGQDFVEEGIKHSDAREQWGL